MSNLTIQIGDLVLAESCLHDNLPKGIVGFIYKVINTHNDEKHYKIFWNDEAFQDEEYSLTEVIQYRKDFIKTYRRMTKQNDGKA